MSFIAFPPEINSGLLYGGAGAAPLLAAASAWDGVATVLQGLAQSFNSVVTGLTAGPWTGPASVAMASAAVPYVGWLTGAAGQAEFAGAQSRAAATAFETAMLATVHPAAVTANRVSLAALVATNILGQNTPAIAATESDYVEMWAQDVTAMMGYHADAAAVVSPLSSFAVPPVSLSGVAAGVSSVVSGVQGLAGQAQSALSSVGSAVPIESLASVGQFATLPVSMLMSPLLSLASQSANAGTAGVAGTASTLAADVPNLVDAVPLANTGGAVAAGVGKANLVGSLSVPPAWARTAPAAAAGSALTGHPAGLAGASAAAEMAGMTGATGGMPMMPMPLGAGAGSGMPPGMLGRGGGGGTQVVQSRPTVVPRVGIG